MWQIIPLRSDLSNPHTTPNRHICKGVLLWNQYTDPIEGKNLVKFIHERKTKYEDKKRYKCIIYTPCMCHRATWGMKSYAYRSSGNIKVFHAIYKKFLTSNRPILIIIHHKDKIQPKLKEVKCIGYLGHYHTPTWTLTPSEEHFLDEFLKALYKINPSLHKSFNSYEKSKYSHLDTRMGSIFQC